MTLVIENVEEKYIEAFKALAKGAHASVKETHKKPKKRLRKWILEYEKEKQAGKLKTYADFDAFLRDL